MNKRIPAVLLSIFILSLCHSSEPLTTGVLEITFTDIRNSKGQIAIGINSGPEGWPRKPDMDPNWKKNPVKDGRMTVRVPDLPFGTYAVSVLDDENANLEMDMFLGIPREGFGFSQNPKVGMSAPDFEDCSFELKGAITRIEININYIGKGK
jgi:uncharacterized protein (DUF2141 family)